MTSASASSSLDSNANPVFADIRSRRLDLIAITPQSLRIQQRIEEMGGAQMKTELGASIGATVPDQWPPENWEPHVFDYLLRLFAENPESIGWCRYLALRASDGDSQGRTLIGTFGCGLPKPESGEAEIGYGVLPDWQGRGLAAEAVEAMLPWLRTQRKIEAFVAQTFPDLYGSIRVLEKCGFEFGGAGFEEGAILYRKLVVSA